MKENRLNRIKIFDKFYDGSKKTFETLRDNDSRAEIFEMEYMLCVCPGSRNGGQEKRIVEVFWGARPYEFETKGKNWKSLTETGVTLFFYRNDTGHITISLYPAKTENIKPIEDSITIHKWLDPIKLENPEFIKSVWNDFIAYMEYTSLDGTPNFQQRLKVSYLRNFKNTVIDKKWQPTKFSVFSKDVLKFVLTVGLSGFVFFIVSWLREPDKNIVEVELKEINKKEQLVIDRIDKILESELFIKPTSKTIDSLNLRLEDLKKIAIKNNEEEQLIEINKNIKNISIQLRNFQRK